MRLQDLISPVTYLVSDEELALVALGGYDVLHLRRTQRYATRCDDGYIQVNPKHESDKTAFFCGRCGCDHKLHQA